MWVTIESTSKYTLRARSLETSKVVGCLLVATASDGTLLFAQFVVGVTAEMIESGW